jgi:PleD family two-component response regulator
MSVAFYVLATELCNLIFIVDDHADSAEALARMLKVRGHDVVVMTHPKLALARLESIAPPKVIVLDMMMPEMDGIEFLQRLRRNPTLNQVPVVAFSGDFTFDTLRRAQSLGIAEYFVKGTIKWEAICAAIDTLAASATPKVIEPDQPGNGGMHHPPN